MSFPLKHVSLLKDEADRQLQDQSEKENRARKRVEKLRSGHQARQGPIAEKDIQDIELAGVRDVNRTMLHDLKNIAADHPGIGIAEKLEALGVKLPG